MEEPKQESTPPSPNETKINHKFVPIILVMLFVLASGTNLLLRIRSNSKTNELKTEMFIKMSYTDLK